MLNRTEDVALLVARLLVAALLLPSGIDKLLHFSRFDASLAAKGVPYAKFVAASILVSRTPMPAHSVASRRTSLASATFVAMELPAKLPISQYGVVMIAMRRSI